MPVAAIRPIPPRASPVLVEGEMTLPWYLYFKSLQQAVQALQGGISANVTTAKLSSADGSMTFVNGILTAETQAT